MDRREVLKGFGGVIGISGELRSRPLLPTSITDAAGTPEAGLSEEEEPFQNSDACDIRKLSQHFKDVDGNTAPWIFVPQENIESITTWDHPGYVTIADARKGVDIKGILEKPIAIDEYPLPWEFHLGMVQAGLSTQHGNYALGLNLAVTFSDPSTWPKDRTQLPPEAGAEVRPDYNWHPGVLNIPREGRHRFSNSCPSPDTEKDRSAPIFVEFDPELPESILSHRPVFMLLQILDSSHLRIGLKANKADRWELSKSFDTMRTFGKIGKFLAHPCITVSLTAGIEKGWGVGNYPRCQQVHLDYVHHRHGLSARGENTVAAASAHTKARPTRKFSREQP